MDVNLNRLMIRKKCGQRVYLPELQTGHTVCHHRLRDMLGSLTLSTSASSGKGEPADVFNSDMAYVNIFDFGGETVFTNFQHIFLNADAVILLVFSLHNCLDKLDVLNRVYIWLQFISTYTQGKHRPPVILIGTHLDQIKLETSKKYLSVNIQDKIKSPDGKSILGKIGDANKNGKHHEPSQKPKTEKENTVKFVMDLIQNNPEVTEIYDNHVVTFFPVSNLDPHDPVLEEIWKAILKYAPYQAQWGMLIPCNWISLEHDLQRMREKNVRVITFQELEDRAAKFDISDVTGFLRYMHTARMIITFPGEDPRQPIIPPDMTVILDPTWMIKAFRLIVTTASFHRANLGADDALLREYTRTGRLTNAFIYHVWGKAEAEEGFLTHRHTLLHFIQKAELIVKPVSTNNEDVDVYIVPSQLENVDTSSLKTYLEGGKVKTSSTLCILFQDKFIPNAIHDKLLASLIYRFEVLADPGKADALFLQRGLACFVLTESWKMIVHCKERIVKVTLFSEKDDTRPNSEGFVIRPIIERLIQKTLRLNDQDHLQYQIYLHNHFEARTDDKLVAISQFSAGTTGKAGKASTSMTNADYDFWYRQKVQRPATPMWKRYGVDMGQPPTLKQMSLIAKHIVGTYTMFFVELDMTDNEITQIRLGNACLDIRSQMTRILIAWRNKNGGANAKIARIIDAMEVVSMNSDAVLMDMSPDSEMAKAKQKSVRDLHLPSRCLQPKEFPDVALLVGKMYVIYFIELNLNNEDISNAEINNKRDAMELKMELLRKWVQRTGRQAYIQDVVMAARECDHLNWLEMAEKLKSYKG